MKPKKLTTNYSFSMDNQAGELLRKLAIIHTRSNSNLIAYLLKEEGKKYGLIESRVINQIEKPVIDRKKIISLAEEAELDCVMSVGIDIEPLERFVKLITALELNDKPLEIDDFNKSILDK